MGFTGYKDFDSGSGSLLADYLKEWKDKTFGQNATAKKYETGGGSAGTSGVGRHPSGYADDTGTPSVSPTGAYTVFAPLRLYPTRFNTISGHDYVSSLSLLDNYSVTKGDISVIGSTSGIKVVNGGSYDAYVLFGGGYRVSVPAAGYLSVSSGTRAYTDMGGYIYSSDDAKELWSITHPYISSIKGVVGRSVSKGSTYFINFDINSKSGLKATSDFTSCETQAAVNNFVVNSDGTIAIPLALSLWIPHNSEAFLGYDSIPVSYVPNSTTINQTNNITINNNTWNGNIYQDNSTNLTYIYPQYTTINENNETVTNISENPIIYNNETKQYYTYDQTTKNYYYITYNVPSPSPTPAPTDKPGGSISTPETGKPGGDVGDTTGILAVLVEIRDNMIQGFAELKATLVQGWADLSANFTLAIENLNLNITNIFNKKFPDQSTPETAQPSPSPSPSPEPTPDPALPAPVEPSTGDKWSDDIVSGTSISGTVNAKAGDYVLATVSARSALTIPDSMTYLYKGNVFASNSVNQSMSFAYQKIDEDGTYTYTFKQATAGRMYLSLIVLSDIEGLSYSGKYHIEVQSETPVSVPEKSDGNMLVWGCSSTGWLTADTSNSKSWITNPDDLTYIGGASNSGQSRQANFIDLGTGAVSRTFFPYEDPGEKLFFVVDAVEIIPKTITPSPTPSPSPTPNPGTDPTPAPTDKPSNSNTNNFWNFVFPGGNDDGTENGHKGILWALISLLIAVVTFVLGLGSAYSYVFPFLPAGLVTTIHICVLVLLLFAIIKFVRSFL